MKSKGIKGPFQSPINGDTIKKGNTLVPRQYDIRISESLLDGETTGLNLIDYNEQYKLYYSPKKNKHGYNGVIVLIR